MVRYPGAGERVGCDTPNMGAEKQATVPARTASALNCSALLVL